MRKILLAICAFALPGLAGDRPSDLTGTPDLIVDGKMLQNHWIVREEDFTATACDAIEGGISAGTHRVIRFTVSTPNVGDADLFIGDPNVHFNNNDGLFEFATCHQHFHFRHYASYQLIDPVTGRVWRAAKRGFCMIDFAPAPMADGAVKTWAYRNCGRVGVAGNQGISHGWADAYVWQLQGQMIVFDGGDGQPLVPPGRYVIRITVNPPFVSSGPKDPCPFKDSAGFCHQLPESDYTNNVAESVVDVPDHPGRSGVGPGTADKPPHDSDLRDDAGERVD